MLYTADANGVADSAFNTLVRHINSKYDIVMVNWAEGFIFNETLLQVKDYVLVCFCEYGWDKSLTETHIWGFNSFKFQRYYTGDWIKFDNWVKSNPPKIILKREMVKDDLTISYSHNSITILPIEYPCTTSEWVADDEYNFSHRPFSVFQYWGRSSEHRIRIHGEIWVHGYNRGFQPCDNLNYLPHYMQHEEGEKWVSLWIPHWARIDINYLLAFNNKSKLSLSWRGAGFKCFRTMEAPVNSVMVMEKNNYAWTHDWNETNCILVEPGKEIEGIEAALKTPNLYNIYLEGMKTVDKYRLPNYSNHLESLINNA